MVEHDVFALRTVFHQPLFEVDIILHCIVAVEVIFGDIEKDGDVRAERGERLQLEGGDLRNGDPVLAQFFEAIEHGSPDVAARHGALMTAIEDMFDHGDGSRLAVSSRHGNDRTAHLARRKFRLPDDRLPLFAKEDGQRLVDGNARAQDKHVAFVCARRKLIL